MQKISILLGILLGCIVLFIGAFSAHGEDFGYEIQMVEGEPFAVILRTEGNKYMLMPRVLRAEGYIAYFAAQDFTHEREMLMHEFKEVKVVVDKEDEKGVKAVISLIDQNNIPVNDYELVVSLKIKRGLPSLTVYSKLLYKGREPARTSLNWGIINGFRYYAYPENGRVRARKLEVAGIMRGRATKLGRGAYPWVWPTDGRGNGLGIMTLGMLARSPLDEVNTEIIINDVPPKKTLSSGEFMDVPFILLPTTKEEGGFRPVKSLYKRVKGIRWEMEKW